MKYFDLPPIIEHMLKVSADISDLNFSVGQAPAHGSRFAPGPGRLNRHDYE